MGAEGRFRFPEIVRNYSLPFVLYFPVFLNENTGYPVTISANPGKTCRETGQRAPVF
jgi:hypothetical protein